MDGVFHQDALGVRGSCRPFGDVHRPPADQRTAACACAQFRQSHPHRHIVILSFSTFALMPHLVCSLRTAIRLTAKETVKCNHLIRT